MKGCTALSAPSVQPWSGRAPGWAEIAALARRAEDIGFDSFWLPDHLLFHFEHVHKQGAWDVWSLLAGEHFGQRSGVK